MTWAEANLVDLCEINVGRTPARADPTFWGEGEPWLSIADMSQGRVIRSTREQITPLAARAGRRVEPGTVLLSFKLSIGKVAIAGVPLYTNEAIAALPIRRPDSMLPEFLARALEVQDLAGASNRAAMGATLNKAKLKTVRIPVPPISEQRRIAVILDQADALRAKRTRSLNLFASIEASIFEEMFDRGEFPLSQLRDLVDADDRINYGVVQPGDHVAGGVPLIRVSDLTGRRVNRSQLKRISPQIEAKYARSRIRGTEILLSCVGSIGLIALTCPDDIGANVARAVTRIPISEPAMRMYVAAVLSSRRVQRYFVTELRTVSQPTLNGKQIGETLVPVPPESMVHEFADRMQQLEVKGKALHASDSEFATLQRSLAASAFGEAPP